MATKFRIITEHGLVEFSINEHLTGAITGMPQRDGDHGPLFGVWVRPGFPGFVLELTHNYRHVLSHFNPESGPGHQIYRLIDEHADALVEACRFYAARLGNLMFEGSEIYLPASNTE
jgi:hypothetical protein